MAKAKRKHRSKEKMSALSEMGFWQSHNLQAVQSQFEKALRQLQESRYFIGANEFHQRIHLPQVIWVYIKYRENKKYAWQHKITAAIKDNILYVASFRGFISYSSFFLPSTFRSAQRPQQKAQPKQMPLPVVHSSYS